MIRLIISDIDGTLFPEGSNTLDPEFFQVVKELKKNGVLFAAGSGRGYESAVNLFQEAKDDMILMVENGGYARIGDRELFRIPFDESLAVEILNYIHQLPDARLYLMSKTDYGYTDAQDKEFIREMSVRYKMRYVQIPRMADEPEGALKISVYTQGDALQVSEDAKKHFGSRACIFAAGRHWTDFEPPAVNKGTGLARLQEVLGISREETAAFGDNLNDVDMLKQAQYSYAVGDAREEVRKIARFVAGKSGEKGVLNVMKEILEDVKAQNHALAEE